MQIEFSKNTFTSHVIVSYELPNYISSRGLKRGSMFSEGKKEKMSKGACLFSFACCCSCGRFLSLYSNSKCVI